MRTKVVLETVDELVHLFDPDRNLGDPFPFVGTDDLYLELRVINHKVVITLEGLDKHKYEMLPLTDDETEKLLQQVFRKINITLKISRYDQ